MTPTRLKKFWDIKPPPANNFEAFLVWKNNLASQYISRSIFSKKIQVRFE